jgi:hypothetical protein
MYIELLERLENGNGVWVSCREERLASNKLAGEVTALTKARIFEGPKCLQTCGQAARASFLKANYR